VHFATHMRTWRVACLSASVLLYMCTLLLNNCKEEECKELWTGKARRGITWRKIRVWRIEGIGKNNEWGIYRICSNMQDWSHIVRWEWREFGRTRFWARWVRNISAEIGIRRIVASVNKEKWQKICRSSNRPCVIKILIFNRLVLCYRNSNLIWTLDSRIKESNSGTPKCKL
jgi:hypothetical protein